MVKYTLYLTQQQVAALRDLDGTVSEHIRRALSDYLNQTIVTKSPTKGGK